MKCTRSSEFFFQDFRESIPTHPLSSTLSWVATYSRCCPNGCCSLTSDTLRPQKSFCCPEKMLGKKLSACPNTRGSDFRESTLYQHTPHNPFKIKAYSRGWVAYCRVWPIIFNSCKWNLWGRLCDVCVGIQWSWICYNAKCLGRGGSCRAISWALICLIQYSETSF